VTVSSTTARPRAEGYRLVIFDWDGTLLDSVGSIVECTQVTLAELPVAAVPERTIRSVLGLGLRETVETLCPGCDEELFQRVLETYRKHWFGGYSTKPVLFAGVTAALDELRAQGYLLAVATAKGRIGLDADLGTTGLAGHFAATRTITEAPSKPHPGMVLDILDEVGVPAAEALVVGDTTHDLRMAANAGVTGVAVCSGSHPRAELLELEPAGCLASAVELPSWLNRVPA
jgi:phosphoglycolate phosphatase